MPSTSLSAPRPLSSMLKFWPSIWFGEFGGIVAVFSTTRAYNGVVYWLEVLSQCLAILRHIML